MKKRQTSARRGAAYYPCAVPLSSRKTDPQPSLCSGSVNFGVWRILLLFSNKATPVSVQKESRDWKNLEALFLYCFCKHKTRILIEIFKLTAKH